MRKATLLAFLFFASVMITVGQPICIVGKTLCTGNVGSSAGPGGYTTVQANGVATPQWSTVNFIQGSNMTITCASDTGLMRSNCTFSSTGGGGGGGSFSAITSGANNSAAMTCGSGCSLNTSGTGFISANGVNGFPVTGTSGNLLSFGVSNTIADSLIAASQVVRAIIPGAGVAHFAGATQIVTSSAIVNSDIQDGTINVAAKVNGLLSTSNGGTGATGLVGIPKANGLLTWTNAAFGDITTLWSGSCNAGTFLRGDGSCQTPVGSGTVNGGTATHLAYYATTTSAVSDMGADFTFTTHTLASASTAILDLHLAGSGGLLLPGALSTGLVTVTTSTGAIASVAAPAGAVVGTTDAQTLTNKSIAGTEINSGLVGATFGGTGADLHASTGIIRAGNPFTASELTGDATTTGSNVVTVVKVNGVTYPASPSTDTTAIVTAANTGTYVAITNCGDSTHALAYSTSTHLFSCQSITASATAGGSNTQLQYNNSTALGGISDLTFNGTHTITLGSSGILDLHAAATSGVLFPGGFSSGLVFVTTTTGGVSSVNLSGDATTAGSAVTTVVKVNGVTYSASPAIDSTPIVTTSNNTTYTVFPNCGDATHALNYSTTSHTINCQAITATALAGGSNTQLQYNNLTALGGTADFTWNGTHTLAGGASGILDLHAEAAGGLLLPGGLSSGIVSVTTGTGAVTILTAPAGAIVGTTDTQTLTNKSIAGSEINSGIIGATFGGTGADLHLSTGLVRSGNPFTVNELSGDAVTLGSNITTVIGVNGVRFSTLTTGILRNTFSTGQVVIAGPSDFPTLNQNTTGSAATLSGVLVGANFPSYALNQPLLGGGAGNIPIAGTKSGNSNTLATTTGTLTSGHVAVFDVLGNIVDGGTISTGNFGAQGDVYITSVGVGTTFTPGWVFTAGIMQVYLNGVKQRPGGNDFTVVGNTIQFTFTPVAGAVIEVIQ